MRRVVEPIYTVLILRKLDKCGTADCHASQRVLLWLDKSLPFGCFGFSGIEQVTDEREYPHLKDLLLTNRSLRL